jgi:hypothetical protein
MLIRYRLARRTGRAIIDSVIHAVFVRKPPTKRQTDRERLMELKKKWDEAR